jgi:CubicO group peptidase (beta-lactamase class C family)
VSPDPQLPGPAEPIDLSADWVTSPPAEQGVDPAGLAAALDQATTSGVTSVLVVRRGRLVAERYFRPGGADSLYALRSVTKSVMSLLVGAAIDRELIRSTSQTLAELFHPPLPALDAEHGAITIADLLTMRSGIEWNESGNVGEYNGWALAPDQIEYLLAREVVDPPGSRWNYNSAAVHLLAAAVEVNGGGAMAFADRYLLQPLGITSRDWELDNRGIPNGGAGLYLRPRDIAKMGQLVLQRGRSADISVVAADWVRSSTSRRVGTGASLGSLGPLGYGDLWWLGRAGGNDVVLAWGYGGQYVYVVPALELVVVTTATWQGLGAVAGPQMAAIADLITNRIVPAVRPTGS